MVDVSLTTVGIVVLYGWCVALLAFVVHRRQEQARVEAICRGIVWGFTKVREGGSEVVPAGGNEVVPSG